MFGQSDNFACMDRRRTRVRAGGQQPRAAVSAGRGTAPGCGRCGVALEGVTVRYGKGQGAVVALDDVTVSFAGGSFTAVMGPSGSGKSTLLQCAAGLERPASGTVWLGGVDTGTLSETGLTRLRREKAGFVFQAFNLLPALTAAQNVALPLRLAGRRPSGSEISDALAAVGLDERLGRRRPGELSGGQQQRVAIARAVAVAPEVLFADEPTGALDSASGREVLVLLRSVVDERGQTVVLVTHDPVAAGYADRVVFLADGRLAGEMRHPSAAELAARLGRIGG
jgi:putative ABC transport system ATP-binding protein